MNQDSFPEMKAQSVRAQSLRDRLRETTTDAILDATEHVASKDGIAATSLQAIAKRAGVAVGTIYNYFGDKQELFEALFETRRTQLYESIDASAKAHVKQPFAAQLDAFVRSVFEHFDAHRAFLRLALEAEPTRPKVIKGEDGRKHSAMQQLYERAARVVRVGLREKKLKDGDEELLSNILVSFVRGVLVMRSQGVESFALETASVIEIFLNGASR
jgi:AcrR family transcriptional regulator